MLNVLFKKNTHEKTSLSYIEFLKHEMKFLGPNSYKGKNYFELCFKLLKTTEMKQIERQQHVCFDEKVAEVCTS